VVVEAQRSKDNNEDHSVRSERRSALKKYLTEPTLLEIRTLPVSAVVSMGRRNTFLEFTRGSLKTQSLSWALI
jgi:hypothetical protein